MAIELIFFFNDENSLVVKTKHSNKLGSKIGTSSVSFYRDTILGFRVRFSLG